MKQLVLFVACILICLTIGVQPAVSQTPNPIYFGARAGMNLGDVSVTPDFGSGISKSMRTGLAAGAYAEFGVAEGFAITAEALYTQAGFKLTGSGAEATAKYDEIYIPVSGKYKFSMENSTVRPFVFAGGTLGLNVKAEFESGGRTFDVKDSTESIDFGVHFGAGVEFELSPGVNLFVDGRYMLGLKDLDKTASSEAKSRNIGILAGVAFKVN